MAKKDEYKSTIIWMLSPNTSYLNGAIISVYDSMHGLVIKYEKIFIFNNFILVILLRNIMLVF